MKRVFKRIVSVFQACLPGGDYGDTNLAGMTYKRGTHFVIAPTVQTIQYRSDTWMLKFLESLNAGATVYTAMNAADQELYQSYDIYGDYGRYNQRHALGDNSLVLKH